MLINCVDFWHTITFKYIRPMVLCPYKNEKMLNISHCYYNLNSGSTGFPIYKFIESKIGGLFPFD